MTPTDRTTTEDTGDILLLPCRFPSESVAIGAALVEAASTAEGGTEAVSAAGTGKPSRQVGGSKGSARALVGPLQTENWTGVLLVVLAPRSMCRVEAGLRPTTPDIAA